MGTDRLLLIIMSIIAVAIVLMILGQALNQFDSVLRTVLRSPQEEPDPEPVRLRVIAPVAFMVAIAALSIVLALLAR